MRPNFVDVFPEAAFFAADFAPAARDQTRAETKTSEAAAKSFFALSVSSSLPLFRVRSRASARFEIL
jgi:hypothetical protein